MSDEPLNAGRAWWLRGCSALWAGVLSAWICYAEYLGMGAVLGTALLGYGDHNKATGTLLVVLSACVSCLLLAVQRRPYLAGPRGASLALLVTALVWLQTHHPASATAQVARLSMLLLGCTLMLALSSHRVFQRWFQQLPPWLVPAFIYASAISIVASAVRQYLASCLAVQEMQTWGIYLSATALGVLWPGACQHLALRLSGTRWAAAAAGLQSLALVAAAALAWWAYAHSDLALVRSQHCARLGGVDLDLGVLLQRWQWLLDAAQWPSVASLCWALVWGLCIGAIAAIETQTTLHSLHSEPNTPAAPALPPLLRRWAGLGLGLAASTLPPSSLSQSRTQLLWSLAPPNPWAAGVHALALLGIALYASVWLAWMPQLTLAVLMTLIATQMVGSAAARIWQRAYDPAVLPALGLRQGLGLWLVVALTALTGQVLWAFAVPALLFFGLQAWRHRQLRQTMRSKSSAN